MSAAPPSLASWLVSAHPRGEVLTIEERGPSLTLWLLGQPEGFSVPEVQGWLHDVAGVANESASQDTSPQPIPVLLRHALSGLLFSHSEMWARPDGQEPCSVAFTSGEDGIGIGWIGDAEVSVLLDNQPCDVRWVLVRDDHGREARAWSVEPGRDVRVTLRWQLIPGDADSPRVLLEARTRMGSIATEPSAVVAAPRFVPPASRRTPVVAAPEREPIAIPGPEPVEMSEPELEPVAVTLLGPSVVALYEPDPPANVDESMVIEPAHEEQPTEFVPQAEAMLTIERGTPEPAEESPPALEVSETAVPASPHPPSTAPDHAAAPELDPERPSSGIARWLSKSFGWIRPRPRNTDPDPLPPPVPMVEPLAEQQEMVELVAPADEMPLEAADIADELVAQEVVAQEIVVEEVAAEELPSQRDHEDELARSAAALAELLGGWEQNTEAADTPPPAPIEIVAEPSRIFDVLPEQIPPTPEAAEVTARAEPVVDPRERSLTDDAPRAAIEMPTVVAPIARAPVATAPPRLPSFVRTPVARPDDQPLHELDPHARLDLEPRFPSPPSPSVDPHERSFGAVEIPPSTVSPEPATTVEAIETPIAAMPPPVIVEELAATPAPPAPAPPAPEATPDPWLNVESAPSPRRRAALHPEWPSENEVQTDERRTRSTWIALGAVIAVLFGVGWLVGSLQGGRHGTPAALTAKGPLAFLGIKGPTFKTDIQSRPDGAWILVDGTPTQKRTPMTLELPPGKHEITLSFGQWGQAVYPVEGKKHEMHRVDGTLWGSLDVGTPELGSVIAVAVDGRARGFAPVVIDSLAPGPHQIRFSGPGMPSWGQTVEIRVAQRQEVLARTVRSPATGVLQVRANRTEDGESEPYSGAKVWIDGEPRGATPLTVELPRGPHSVRIELGDDRPPVQMIDLPGGNQRFATFELGTGEDHPELRLDAPARIDGDRPAVISATLTEVAPREVREMWLHVQGPDGSWSRYPMSRLQGQLSPVGAVAFPVSQIGPSGRTQWYSSAVTTQGDEFFSEVHTMAGTAPKH